MVPQKSGHCFFLSRSRCPLNTLVNACISDCNEHTAALPGPLTHRLGDALNSDPRGPLETSSPLPRTHFAHRKQAAVFRETQTRGALSHPQVVPATSPNSQPSMLNDDREGEGMVGGPEFLSLGPTYPWGSRRRAWWDVSASRSETEQRLRRLTWTACMHVRAMK